ncbi:MAG: glycosyltransferase family 2 protein [Nitrososphaerota archaeon]|nr:glycosyltransferase family 2 protein [Nitrososphaerota archaeon]
MSQPQPLISVIILNYNGKNYLNNCLASVLKNNYDNYEVILVDNASKDKSIQTAEHRFGDDPHLKIIKNKSNLGFSGGNNAGYAHCRGEYIVFLNNDTTVDTAWLTSLADAMQGDSTIGLAQSKILMMNSDQIQIGGWIFSDYLIRKHPITQNQSSQINLKPCFEVSVASGASMITRRTLIEKYGLFEAKIPFFYDDTLLSVKTWLAGKRVVTITDSQVHHILGATSAWTLEKTTFNLLRAKICLLFDIYYQPYELLKAIFVNAVDTLINTIYALKNKRLAVVYANIQGFTWMLGNLRFLWQNRRTRWSKAKISPQELREKIIKIHLPIALYLLPSKLGTNTFATATANYEHTLHKNHTNK